MRHVVAFLLKPLFQRLFVVTLLAASSSAWGESLSAVASVDESRDVAGYIVVAIIFNLALVTIILLLLRKEWKKHKVASKPALNDKCEGK